MRLSSYYIKTLREAPSDASVKSHILLTRGGFIKKVAAGIYTLLPLGLRVHRKIETIIRAHMTRAGAVEFFMPSIQPASLWERSGRWDQYGAELLRIKDRHGVDYCYGPTHEELITDMARRDIKSYRDLPVRLYHVQTKFRDEIRPRFGVMRSREFIMKDAYSFDADQAGLDESYAKMRAAYTDILGEIGLSFRVVEADSGQIGGFGSEEFMVDADAGEDLIVLCDSCSYSSNLEAVEVGLEHDRSDPSEEAGVLKKVATPGAESVEDVASSLGVSSDKVLKTLFFLTDKGEFIGASTLGSGAISPVKLARAIGAASLTLADDELVLDRIRAPVGSIGPIGLDVRIIFDRAVELARDIVVGANEEGHHYINANPGRDFHAVEVADIKEATEGSKCARCESGRFTISRGIEVGHIFKLGAKYSGAMGALFQDRDGQDRPIMMGCYGMGLARTMAAAIEQSHDDAGIIWPIAIAPFEVAVLALSDDEPIMTLARDVYESLIDAGVDVVFDDRSARAGEKFTDADLIGYPMQVIIGRKSLQSGLIEIKTRKDSRRLSEPRDRLIERVLTLKSELAR